MSERLKRKIDAIETTVEILQKKIKKLSEQYNRKYEDERFDQTSDASYILVVHKKMLFKNLLPIIIQTKAPVQAETDNCGKNPEINSPFELLDDFEVSITKIGIHKFIDTTEYKEKAIEFVKSHINTKDFHFSLHEELIDCEDQVNNYTSNDWQYNDRDYDSPYYAESITRVPVIMYCNIDVNQDQLFEYTKKLYDDNAFTTHGEFEEFNDDYWELEVEQRGDRKFYIVEK